MKWNCGPEPDPNYLSKWHRWFAWYPVRVANCDCRWLEVVERKGTFHRFGIDSSYTWEYRAAKKGP